MATDMDSLPDISDDEDQHSIVWKLNSRKRVSISNQEVLMMLRLYQLHPCSWKNIIGNIKENVHQLPSDAQKNYETNTLKQLKDRLCNKLSKLISTPEKNILNTEIRTEVKKIKEIEKGKSKPDKRKQERDFCEEIVAAISSDDDQTPNLTKVKEKNVQIDKQLRKDKETSSPQCSVQEENGRGEKSAPPKSKKRPLLELVRENHLAYNSFITKKVPKLLRALGVSSDENSS